MRAGPSGWSPSGISFERDAGSGLAPLRVRGELVAMPGAEIWRREAFSLHIL